MLKLKKFFSNLLQYIVLLYNSLLSVVILIIVNIFYFFKMYSIIKYVWKIFFSLFLTLEDLFKFVRFFVYILYLFWIFIWICCLTLLVYFIFILLFEDLFGVYAFACNKAFLIFFIFSFFFLLFFDDIFLDEFTSFESLYTDFDEVDGDWDDVHLEVAEIIEHDGQEPVSELEEELYDADDLDEATEFEYVSISIQDDFIEKKINEVDIELVSNLYFQEKWFSLSEQVLKKFYGIKKFDYEHKEHLIAQLTRNLCLSLDFLSLDNESFKKKVVTQKILTLQDLKKILSGSECFINEILSDSLLVSLFNGIRGGNRRNVFDVSFLQPKAYRLHRTIMRSSNDYEKFIIKASAMSNKISFIGINAYDFNYFSFEDVLLDTEYLLLLKLNNVVPVIKQKEGFRNEDNLFLFLELYKNGFFQKVEQVQDETKLFLNIFETEVLYDFENNKDQIISDRKVFSTYLLRLFLQRSLDSIERVGLDRGLISHGLNRVESYLFKGDKFFYRRRFLYLIILLLYGKNNDEYINPLLNFALLKPLKWDVSDIDYTPLYNLGKSRINLYNNELVWGDELVLFKVFMWGSDVLELDNKAQNILYNWTDKLYIKLRKERVKEREMIIFGQAYRFYVYMIKTIFVFEDIFYFFFVFFPYILNFLQRKNFGGRFFLKNLPMLSYWYNKLYQDKVIGQTELYLRLSRLFFYPFLLTMDNNNYAQYSSKDLLIYEGDFYNNAKKIVSKNFVYSSISENLSYVELGLVPFRILNKLFHKYFNFQLEYGLTVYSLNLLRDDSSRDLYLHYKNQIFLYWDLEKSLKLLNFIALDERVMNNDLYFVFLKIFNKELSSVGVKRFTDEEKLFLGFFYNKIWFYDYDFSSSTQYREEDMALDDAMSQQEGLVLMDEFGEIYTSEFDMHWDWHIFSWESFNDLFAELDNYYKKDYVFESQSEGVVPYIFIFITSCFFWFLCRMNNFFEDDNSGFTALIPFYRNSLFVDIIKFYFADISGTGRTRILGENFVGDKRMLMQGFEPLGVEFMLTEYITSMPELSLNDIERIEDYNDFFKFKWEDWMSAHRYQVDYMKTHIHLTNFFNSREKFGLFRGDTLKWLIYSGLNRSLRSQENNKWSRYGRESEIDLLSLRYLFFTEKRAIKKFERYFYKNTGYTHTNSVGSAISEKFNKFLEEYLQVFMAVEEASEKRENYDETLRTISREVYAPEKVRAREINFNSFFTRERTKGLNYNQNLDLVESALMEVYPFVETFDSFKSWMYSLVREEVYYSYLKESLFRQSSFMGANERATDSLAYIYFQGLYNRLLKDYIQYRFKSRKDMKELVYRLPILLQWLNGFSLNFRGKMINETDVGDYLFRLLSEYGMEDFIMNNRPNQIYVNKEMPILRQGLLKWFTYFYKNPYKIKDRYSFDLFFDFLDKIFKNNPLILMLDEENIHELFMSFSSSDDIFVYLRALDSDYEIDEFMIYEPIPLVGNLSLDTLEAYIRSVSSFGHNSSSQRGVLLEMYRRTVERPYYTIFDMFAWENLGLQIANFFSGIRTPSEDRFRYVTEEENREKIRRIVMETNYFTKAIEDLEPYHSFSVIFDSLYSNAANSLVSVGSGSLAYDQFYGNYTKEMLMEDIVEFFEHPLITDTPIKNDPWERYRDFRKSNFQRYFYEGLFNLGRQYIDYLESERGFARKYNPMMSMYGPEGFEDFSNMEHVSVGSTQYQWYTGNDDLYNEESRALFHYYTGPWAFMLRRALGMREGDMPRYILGNMGTFYKTSKRISKGRSFMSQRGRDFNPVNEEGFEDILFPPEDGYIGVILGTSLMRFLVLPLLYIYNIFIYKILPLQLRKYFFEVGGGSELRPKWFLEVPFIMENDVGKGRGLVRDRVIKNLGVLNDEKYQRYKIYNPIFFLSPFRIEKETILLSKILHFYYYIRYYLFENLNRFYIGSYKFHFSEQEDEIDRDFHLPLRLILNPANNTGYGFIFVIFIYLLFYYLIWVPAVYIYFSINSLFDPTFSRDDEPSSDEIERTMLEERQGETYDEDELHDLTLRSDLVGSPGLEISDVVLGLYDYMHHDFTSLQEAPYFSTLSFKELTFYGSILNLICRNEFLDLKSIQLFSLNKSFTLIDILRESERFFYRDFMNITTPYYSNLYSEFLQLLLGYENDEGEIREEFFEFVRERKFYQLYSAPKSYLSAVKDNIYLGDGILINKKNSSFIRNNYFDETAYNFTLNDIGAETFNNPFLLSSPRIATWMSSKILLEGFKIFGVNLELCSTFNPWIVLLENEKQIDFRNIFFSEYLTFIPGGERGYAAHYQNYYFQYKSGEFVLPFYLRFNRMDSSYNFKDFSTINLEYFENIVRLGQYYLKSNKQASYMNIYSPVDVGFVVPFNNEGLVSSELLIGLFYLFQQYLVEEMINTQKVLSLGLYLLDAHTFDLNMIYSYDLLELFEEVNYIYDDWIFMLEQSNDWLITLDLTSKLEIEYPELFPAYVQEGARLIEEEIQELEQMLGEDYKAKQSKKLEENLAELRSTGEFNEEELSILKSDTGMEPEDFGDVLETIIIVPEPDEFMMEEVPFPDNFITYSLYFNEYESNAFVYLNLNRVCLGSKRAPSIISDDLFLHFSSMQFFDMRLLFDYWQKYTPVGHLFFVKMSVISTVQNNEYFSSVYLLRYDSFIKCNKQSMLFLTNNNDVTNQISFLSLKRYFFKFIGLFSFFLFFLIFIVL